MTIIQDWNNWRSACQKTQQAKHDLDVFAETMTQKCSAEQYFNNYIKKLNYGDLLKKMNGLDIDKKAIECRASSCFYKLVYDEPREETNLRDKCVHVRYDGSLDERHCAGCAHREEMKDYVALQNKLETAKAEQHKSRDILLRRLFFWKQIIK